MLLADLAAVLNGLPAVFSTPQWGGRAYKVRRGASGKPKLLAFVAPDETADGVTVSFKLKPPEAQEQTERYDWIAPHSFRTLAPSGWLTARVRTKRQLAVLRKLLEASHDLQHPPGARSADAAPATRQKRDAAAARIDQVLREAADEGWTPQSDW
jgi:predicted DNA-binding protein (MmcQ/YjbR family)